MPPSGFGAGVSTNPLTLPVAYADAIQEIVSELKLSISLMVATHSHVDHIFEAARIKQKLNVALAIHEAEANMELWSRD